MALGFTKTLDDTPWAALNNVASLGISTQASVNMAYRRQFELQELSTRYFTACLPSKLGVFSGLCLQNGVSGNLFNRYALGYSKKLTPTLTAGFQFNYNTHQFTNCELAATLYSAMGIRYSATKRLNLAVFIQNPEQAKMSYGSETYLLPSFFNAGMQWMASSNVSILTEIEKENSQAPLLKMGVALTFIEVLKINCGLTNGLYQYTFGASYGYKNSRLDLGFAHHQILGLTSMAGLSYVFHKSQKQ